MKVSAIIDFQITDLGKGGMVPRYVVLTARALDLLIQEVGESLDAIDQTRGDGLCTFRNLELVVSEMNRFTPVCVVGSVHDEMNLYRNTK